MMEGKLTILFDPPYWVGIFEKQDENCIQVARYVFGAEPTEPQLLYFALHEYQNLTFSRSEAREIDSSRVLNFKRRLREVRKEMEKPRSSTRAQDILRQAYETACTEMKKSSSEQREAENDRKYFIRKSRRAEKHRGH